MAFGISSSKSSKSGGTVGSSDTLANNNAYASAPVINFTDSRQASGKYVRQKENSLTVNYAQTDYGAVGAALGVATDTVEQGLDLAASLGRDGMDLAESLATETIGYVTDINRNSFDFAEQLSNDNKYIVTESLNAVTDSGREALASNMEALQLATDTQRMALDDVTSIADDAMSLIDDNSKALAQSSREISAYAADSITNNLNSALAFAEKQSMPDKGVFSESIKWIAGTAVVLGGLSFIGKKYG